MKSITKQSLACLLLFIICFMAVGEDPEDSVSLRNKWESENLLKRICCMDELLQWAGLPPDQLTISSDTAEGTGALQIPLDILPGQHFRIEHNFVSAHHDGFRNMMAMGMEEEDFTPYRTITFQYKSDIDMPANLLFRIYDRVGGWLEWAIPSLNAAKDWQQVILAVPAQPGEQMNLRRTGGILFEIRAEEKPVRGTAWFDDLKLLTTTTPDAIAVNTHPIPETAFSFSTDTVAINNAIPSPEIQLVLNMSPLEIPFQRCDAGLAIRFLQEELKRFSNLQHVTLYLNPSSNRNIHDDPEYLPKIHDSMVKVAEWCERNSVRFYQSAGSEGHGFMPVETMFAVLDAAPQMCLGFLFGEASVDTNNHTDYLVTLMDRLVTEKKKCLYFQQSSYWLGVMLHSDGDAAKLIRAIENPKYRDVFVPMWENLLPCSQALCYGTSMGFWRGGLTSDWGISAQSWGYANMNFGGTLEMPGHWWIRMFLMTAVSGGRFIEIEPIWPFDGENTEGQVLHAKQWGHNLRWMGKLRSQIDNDLHPSDRTNALRGFDRLVSTGVVRVPATPEQCRSLPEVTLKAIGPDNSSSNRYNWGLFRRGIDPHWWMLGDCPSAWETSVQTTDIFRYLYDSSHLYDQTIPTTPFGLVSIVPSASLLENKTQIIEVDCGSVVQAGNSLDVEESINLIEDTYKKAQQLLPFQADHCFLSVVQVAPDAFMAYLIDPEERFPVGVETALNIRQQGPWNCTDMITKTEIPVAGDKIQVDIPAGSFRILLLEMIK